MKTRKIGIRFTLQQSYGIQIVSFDEKTKEEIIEAEKFSVYVQVTYNRKNTKFKIGHEEYTKEEFLSTETKRKLLDAEQKIKSIIKMEITYLGEKFSLKGFGKRFTKYDEFVSMGIYNSIYQMLIKNIEPLLENKFITTKETFFCSGLLGSEIGITFTSQALRSKTLLFSMLNIEQVGSMLLERNNFNMVFTNEIKGLLTVINNMFDNSPESDSVLEMTIFDWLMNSSTNGSDSLANKYNLLWDFLII